MKLLPGQTIDRYHIIEQLGSGGVAIVYKAFDTRLECNVAIKVIRTESIPPESLERTRKRFEIEAKKTAQLSHPNIVPVIDYGEFEGMPYLVMKYLPGGTLKDKLAELNKAMSFVEAISLILPIARAVETAHREGIVHRDIKPDNILITASGEPMLSDFGIARVLDSEKRTIETLSMKGFTVGTPEYMAPEQWRGEKIDGRADVYALGVVFYELVTGHRPFTADTVQAVMVKALVDPLPPPRSHNKEIPEKVEQVLYKALEKNPDNRFQSMDEFAKAVQRLALDSGSRNVIPSTEKSRKQLMIGGLALLLMILFTGYIFLFKKDFVSTVLNTSRLESAIQATTVVPTMPVLKYSQTPPLSPELDLTTAVEIETNNPPVPLMDPPADMKLIYSEDFEDNDVYSFSVLNGQWQVVDDGTGNRVYQTKGTNSNWSCVQFGPRGFSDGVIEYKFQLVEFNTGHTDGGKISLKYRTQSWGNEEYTYDFNPYYSTTNIAHADPYPTNNWQNLGQGNIFAKTNRWYSIRLELKGEEMNAYLDGKNIIKAFDLRLKSGNLFFVVDPDAIVQFDEIRVYAP